jgi:sugar phosphate isomerase/epimerase
MDRSIFFERYALSTWLLSSQPLEIALPKIAKAGFRTVELWADSAHLDPRIGPDLDAIQGVIDKTPLRVHSIHAPYSDLRLGYPDGGLLPLWREALGSSLEHASALAADAVILHLVGHDEPLTEARHREGVERALELVTWAVRRAAGLGVRLLIENRLPRGNDRFGSSFADLVPLLPDERIGFCLDTGHTAVGGHDIERELALIGRRLCSVHANNNDGRSDLHQPPPDGTLDWSAVDASFRRHGYKGQLVLEVAGGAAPDAVLSRLGGLWREL